MEFSFADAYESAKDAIGGDILPKGTYDMVVMSAKPKTTAGGKQAFVVVMEVAEGPLSGRRAVEQLTWSPESEVAVRIFSGAMSMMSATRDWIQANRPTPDQIATRITGAVVRVEASEDEWNGSARNRFRFIGSLSARAEDAKPPTLGTPSWPQP